MTLGNRKCNSAKCAPRGSAPRAPATAPIHQHTHTLPKRLSSRELRRNKDRKPRCRCRRHRRPGSQAGCSAAPLRSVPRYNTQRHAQLHACSGRARASPALTKQPACQPASRSSDAAEVRASLREPAPE